VGALVSPAAIFSDSCSYAARFLCNPDCVAERLRFEPSLPLCRAAKSPCMRNMPRILQHTRLIRRIASALESGENSPFSYSAEWRTPSDCQLKVISFFSSEPLDSLNSPDSNRMFRAQPAALCRFIGQPPNRGKM
jgi:hypothetical protein